MLKIKDLRTNEERVVSKKEAAKFMGKRVGKAAAVGAAEGLACGLSAHVIMGATVKLAEKASNSTAASAICVGGAIVSTVATVGIVCGMDKAFDVTCKKEILYICKDEEDDLIDEFLDEEDA